VGGGFDREVLPDEQAAAGGIEAGGLGRREFEKLGYDGDHRVGMRLLEQGRGKRDLAGNVARERGEAPVRRDGRIDGA
jgi:hypothetical protein